MLDILADHNVWQSSPSTETLLESGGTSSDSLHNPDREMKKPLNIFNIKIKEVSTLHFVVVRVLDQI